jgi:hypothetical protein
VNSSISLSSARAALAAAAPHVEALHVCDLSMLQTYALGALTVELGRELVDFDGYINSDHVACQLEAMQMVADRKAAAETAPVDSSGIELAEVELDWSGVFAAEAAGRASARVLSVI